MCVVESDAPTAERAPLVGRGARRRRSFEGWLWLTPAAIYFLVLFLIPVGILVGYSFYSVESLRPVADFTFDNYGEVATNPIFRSIFVRTLRMAAIISFVVVAVSFPFSYLITYVFPRRRQFLYFLVLVSLFGGYLVRIYAWRTMLGRNGVINQGLMAFEVIDEPSRQLLNSQFAIIIVLVNFLIPLGVLPIYSAMQNISPNLIAAAQDLGSSRLHAALKIVLPLSMGGVRAAFAFSFILTAAEWVTASLVGGVRDQMIGNQIVYQFGSNFNWPLGSALAISLVLVAVAIIAVFFVLLRWLSR